MRSKTELMQAILTDKMAQKMIDYISRIYGNSYVGLWLFQAIGVAMGEVYNIAEKLMYETSPATAEILLDYWESRYGIPVDRKLSAEQRRSRIIAKTQSNGPSNPAKLADAVSVALGGVEVDITENVAKNTFLVSIRDVVDDISPAIAVLERKKQAHLIYRVQVATLMVAEADLKVAIALTHAEMNKVKVYDSIDVTPAVFTLDANGTLIIEQASAVLDGGTLVYSKLPNLTDDGILTI